ncbi:sugar ABC transporter ATP-binding protein [Plasticicumulans lactativorans]|nr:sugar ABC transporter ATP-binding protein [Plasticicumulans lactativorans]
MAATVIPHSPVPVREPILELEGIEKSFPGVRALADARLSIAPGEVVALVGENGAGKSTIVKILTGIYQPDAGSLRIDDQPVHLESTQDAWKQGIAAIHQETVAFDELSVAENIFLGHHPRRDGPWWRGGGLVDWAAMRSRARELLAQLEADIDPDTPLKALSVAQKHIVEIAKALSHEARILIMDEPTASLSQREIHDLYRIVAGLKRAGTGILFISHKFDEIFDLCDRYVVMRDGHYVSEGWIADVDSDQLVSMMVGRTLTQVFPRVDTVPGEEVLRVERLGNPTEFDDVSFALRRGEILGFYGLVGAGRSEVMKALFGITRPTRGKVLINGREVQIANPEQAAANRLVYVPEDRQVAGAVLGMSIKDNLTLPSLARLFPNGILDDAKERALTREYGLRLVVKAASWDQLLSELSGGNQQKVVIGKWLATRPDIIILDEPTKGIDIGSKAAVHAFMSELVQQGLAVILVSSELPEVMGMSDRILVMHEGRVRAEFDRSTMSAEAIVTAASGSH